MNKSTDIFICPNCGQELQSVPPHNFCSACGWNLEENKINLGKFKTIPPIEINIMIPPINNDGTCSPKCPLAQTDDMTEQIVENCQFAWYEAKNVAPHGGYDWRNFPGPKCPQHKYVSQYACPTCGIKLSTNDGDGTKYCATCGWYQK